MNRMLRLFLLALCVSLLPAAVVGAGGGSSPQVPESDPNRRLNSAPAWVADPTENGKKRAVTCSWAANASRDEQKQARATASENLIATFKLPATVKIKEMNMWVDANGKTYVHLVAR